MRRYFPLRIFLLVFALGSRAGGAGQGVWTPLALDGGSVHLVAAGPTAGTVYAATAASLYRSLDGGATWRWSGSGLPLTDWRPTVLRVDPLHPRVVYLGSSLGLWKSGDSGRSWRQLNVGVPTAQAIVLEIAFDPQRTATLYLALDAGLLRSTDAGATWRRLRKFPGGAAAVVVDPRTSSKLYAVSTPGQLYRSTDGGASWQALKRAVRDARQLTFDPADSRRLYAVAGGKLVRSVNGGSTWTATSLAGNEIIRLAVAPSGGRLFLLTRRGVFASEDGGATLAPLPDRLTEELLQGLAVAPGDPEQVWVGAVDPAEVFAVPERRSRGGVFRTSDGGATWTRELKGLDALTVDAVTLSPGEDSALFAGTPVGLFRSRDGGATFEEVDLGLGEPASVVGLFTAPGRLYAVARRAGGGPASRSCCAATTAGTRGSGCPLRRLRRIGRSLPMRWDGSFSPPASGSSRASTTARPGRRRRSWAAPPSWTSPPMPRRRTRSTPRDSFRASASLRPSCGPSAATTGAAPGSGSTPVSPERA